MKLIVITTHKCVSPNVTHMRSKIVHIYCKSLIVEIALSIPQGTEFALLGNKLFFCKGSSDLNRDAFDDACNHYSL